jgi:hypothetical protein
MNTNAISSNKITTVSGSLACTTLTIAGYDSYFYLFYNTGGTHGDTNGDFKNINNFGYKYVNGITNSPNTHGTGVAQYYSWSCGLGANYNFGQYVCQFAIPRANDNPTLSVRFRENGGWNRWVAVKTGNADYATNSGTAVSLLSGNKRILGELTIYGNITASF